MDSVRFDRISRHFAAQASRRAALKSGSLGLAAATLAGAGSRAAAQDATPAATPAPGDGDSVAFQPRRAPAEILFAQAFESGTWTPKPGEDGTYLLTVAGAVAQTWYFSDRPDRIFGLTPTQRFLDRLGFTPENPPNAALVAEDADGGEAVLIVELLNPAYDAASASLTYDARPLAGYDDHPLAHAAVRQTDPTLLEAFGTGGLFIDNFFECPSTGVVSCTDKASGAVIGTYYNEGTCDTGTACVPCYVNYDGTCARKFPRCGIRVDNNGAPYTAPTCNGRMITVLNG